MAKIKVISNNDSDVTVNLVCGAVFRYRGEYKLVLFCISAAAAGGFSPTGRGERGLPAYNTLGTDPPHPVETILPPGRGLLVRRRRLRKPKRRGIDGNDYGWQLKRQKLGFCPNQRTPLLVNWDRKK